MRRSRRDLAPFIIPIVVLAVAIIAVIAISGQGQWKLSETPQISLQTNLFGQATYVSTAYALDTDFFSGDPRLLVSTSDAGGSIFTISLQVSAPPTGNFFVYKTAYVANAGNSWSAVNLVPDSLDSQEGTWNSSWIHGSAKANVDKYLAYWTDPGFVTVYTCTEYNKDDLLAAISDAGIRARLSTHFGDNDYAYICGLKNVTSSAMTHNKWRIATFVKPSDCVDVCTEGTKQCSGNYLQNCTTDADGCKEWETIETCAAGTCNTSTFVCDEPCSDTSSNSSVCGTGNVCGFINDTCDVPRLCGVCLTGQCDEETNTCFTCSTIADCATPTGHDDECVDKTCTSGDCSYTNNTVSCNTAGETNDQPGTCAGGVCTSCDVACSLPPLIDCGVKIPDTCMTCDGNGTKCDVAEEDCNTDTWVCEVGCTPSCTGKQCGDNGCGTPCGTCTLPDVCDASNQCVCTPDCSGKQCGDDGCGGSCGTCNYGTCNPNTGQCDCTTSCPSPLDIDCDTTYTEDDGCGTPCHVEGSKCPYGQQCSPVGGVGCYTPVQPCNSPKCVDSSGECRNQYWFGQTSGESQYCIGGSWYACNSANECDIQGLYPLASNECFYVDGDFEYRGEDTIPTELVCDDGYNNDCDDKIDCEDSDCASDPACDTETNEALCLAAGAHWLATSLFESGLEPQCCTDDSDEYYKRQKIMVGGADWSGNPTAYTLWACCDANLDCLLDDGTCITNAQTRNFGTNNYDYLCSWTTWYECQPASACKDRAGGDLICSQSYDGDGVYVWRLDNDNPKDMGNIEIQKKRQDHEDTSPWSEDFFACCDSATDCNKDDGDCVNSGVLAGTGTTTNDWLCSSNVWYECGQYSLMDIRSNRECHNGGGDFTWGLPGVRYS